MVPTVWLANVRLVGDKLTAGVDAAAAAIVIDSCVASPYVRQSRRPSW